MSYLPSAALAFLVAGCTLPTNPATVPGPLTATVAAPEAAVRERVAAAMRAAGLQPEPTPGGGLAAEVRGAARGEWGGCRMLLVKDLSTDFVRSDWAEPEARDLTVTVLLRPAGPTSTEVTAAAATVATYRDIYRNLPVRARCPSTGVLERQLLDAATRG